MDLEFCGGTIPHGVRDSAQGQSRADYIRSSVFLVLSASLVRGGFTVFFFGRSAYSRSTVRGIRKLKERRGVVTSIRWDA